MSLKHKFALTMCVVASLYAVLMWLSLHQLRQRVMRDHVILVEAVLEATGQVELCAQAPDAFTYAHPLHGLIVSAERVPGAAALGRGLLPGEARRVVGLEEPWGRSVVYRANGRAGSCAVMLIEHPKFSARSNPNLLAMLTLRAGIGMLLGVALWGMLALPLVRRIRRMARRAREVLDAGFVGTIDEGAEDELGELARAFDATSACARRDLEYQAEQDLRLRTTLATLSHDVRTPLATLKLALGRLSGGAAPEHILPVLRANLEHVDAMFANFTRMIQLEESVLPLATQPVDLNDVIERLETRFAVLSRDHGVHLVASTDEERAWVEGDPVALEQALGNLVHNALRFARANVAILVTVSGCRCTVEVCDDGPGPRVGTDERPVHTRLHGLGLEIVRQVVERHGGTFSLEPGEAGGARARVDLVRLERDAIGPGGSGAGHP